MSASTRLRIRDRSRLSVPVDISDRGERRLYELDRPVSGKVEARDIDGLPDLIEGDVLGEQGRDLRIEAGDFDSHRDRRRALGELPVGIEVDPHVPMSLARGSAASLFPCSTPLSRPT